MLKTLICGSGSGSFDRKRLSRRHSSKKNPYSARGLDTFSALLADLEEKRQRIYSQIGTQEDAPLVRFVYSSSNQCVPIVVKLKDKTTSSGGHTNQEKVEAESPALSSPQVKKRSVSWKAKAGRCEYYFPAAVILILVSLAVFGRSAAVLCTSLGWYMIPTLQGIRNGKSSNSIKKKEDTIRTRASEKMMVRSAGPSPPRRTHLANWKSFS